MPNRTIKLSANCRHCDAEIIQINNQTRSHPYLGYIALVNEMDNIIIQDNIVFCGECHRIVGLHCTSNNNVVLFASFIAFCSIFEVNE